MKKAAPKSSRKSSRLNIITRTAQRRRIADYLMQHGRATTLELQAKCNALHSPRRIFELRHDFGWKIETCWARDNDLQGRPHRVGSYVLKKSGVMP